MTGGLSFQYSNIKRIVDCIHYSFPEIRVIVGGGIITSNPTVAMTALQHAYAGVIGEGEVTTVDLCNTLEKDGNLDKVEGIIFRGFNKWTQTKPRDEIMDLDSLPYPDYDGFGMSHYLSLPPHDIGNAINSRTYYLIGSRSCPYQCTFCFHSTGKKYRQRSIEEVVNEVEMMVSRYNIEHTMFNDELFARRVDRVKIIDDTAKMLNITWGANFRVDDINEELIDILKNSNCVSLTLGLESASNKILKSMRKNTTVEQIDNALKLIYDAGIPVHGCFILGDIEETYDTAAETINYWKDHKEYNVNLSFIIVYPGTHIYKYAVEKGIIIDEVKFLVLW
jgi:radical SAM superfamily enzyme YgiQ (UPF0313 family)